MAEVAHAWPDHHVLRRPEHDDGGQLAVRTDATGAGHPHHRRNIRSIRGGRRSASWDSEAGTWLPSPGPEMAAFMDELERRWPSLNDDPDASPWASWPLWQPAGGGGTALNISWSFVDSTAPAILRSPHVPT